VVPDTVRALVFSVDEVDSARESRGMCVVHVQPAGTRHESTIERVRVLSNAKRVEICTDNHLHFPLSRKLTVSPHALS
jgi:hypothetical protein